MYFDFVSFTFTALYISYNNFLMESLGFLHIGTCHLQTETILLFFLSTWMPLISFSYLIALTLQVLCQIEVAGVGILALFQILEDIT